MVIRDPALRGVDEPFTQRSVLDEPFTGDRLAAYPEPGAQAYERPERVAKPRVGVPQDIGAGHGNGDCGRHEAPSG
ncbi:hypothetical protein GCM10009678_67720 [Actinomadura kijaniata]|uniref:Uncharacterized protein n=1 Tax=Actinomadura namibiensis TaxID=182080 RepID=A0A7W3LUY6_ACTNM|nr:hypothetical protein [Actinomadura namibiensis]MBA8954788.1 hypothetical protein [Actinomadura namibiensis]